MVIFYVNYVYVMLLMVTEMRMTRWMCGYTKLDGTRNVVIR